MLLSTGANLDRDTLCLIWANVITANPRECWVWRGLVLKRGYGQFSLGLGETGKRERWLAHRLLYEICVGPIPEGLTLDHLCRNTTCVNPMHLEPVTRGENTLRGDTITGRFKRAQACLRGHPFTPSNTYVRKNGGRVCRACTRLRDWGLI